MTPTMSAAAGRALPGRLLSLFLQRSLPAAAVMLGVLAAQGCSSEAAPADKPARPVLVMTVQDQSLAATREIPGVVVARYAADIGFQAGGRIGRRLVEVGQTVRKGQALLQLDASDYTLSLAAAEDQAAAARVDAEQATSDEQRFASLVAEGAVSAADSERQKARAEAARARHQQAQRQVQLARNRSGYTTLAAPYDGVVTAISAEAGQVVAEGQPVVSLARQGEIEIAADIPEAVVAGIAGQPATARVWGSPRASYALSLRELSPAASQPLRTYRARFAIRDLSAADRAALRLGMTAQVALAVAQGESKGVVLPASALVKASGGTTVWLVGEAGKLVSQPVTVLAFQRDTVSVAGLDNGMQVVTAGVQKLDPAIRVRAVERTGAGLDLPAGPRS